MPSEASFPADTDSDRIEELQPVAAVLAFLFPGAGHFYLGHTRRAVLITCGVLGLFFGGLLIGGLDAVDRRENGVWFLAQACTGPVAFAVDAIHQRYFKVYDTHTRAWRSANPDEYRDPATGQPVRISFSSAGGTSVTLPALPGRPAKTISPAYPPKARSVGRMSELGTLFAAIAGFLNVICIIDAGMNWKKGEG